MSCNNILKFLFSSDFDQGLIAPFSRCCFRFRQISCGFEVKGNGPILGNFFYMSSDSSITGPTMIAVGDRQFPIGKIQYGTRGHQKEVDNIDLRRGVSFAVPANWVRIFARTLNLAGGNANEFMRLGASISAGGINRLTPLQIHTNFNLNAAATTVLARPNDTQAIQVLSSDIANQNVLLEFRSILAQVIFNYELVAGQIMPKLPVPGVIHDLQITNNGVAAIRPAVFWDVEL